MKAVVREASAANMMTAVIPSIVHFALVME
jgi:hypothetical protein